MLERLIRFIRAKTSYSKRIKLKPSLSAEKRWWSLCVPSSVCESSCSYPPFQPEKHPNLSTKS